MKHVVLYVVHMYKPFWTKKIWPGWQGGSGKVKILLWMVLVFGFWALRRPLNGSRTPEMDPKWSPQLPLIDLSGFLGSEAKSKAHIWQYLDLPWPPLPTRSNLFGPKWFVQVYRRQVNSGRQKPRYSFWIPSQKRWLYQEVLSRAALSVIFSV